MAMREHKYVASFDDAKYHTVRARNDKEGVYGMLQDADNKCCGNLCMREVFDDDGDDEADSVAAEDAAIAEARECLDALVMVGTMAVGAAVGVAICTGARRRANAMRMRDGVQVIDLGESSFAEDIKYLAKRRLGRIKAWFADGEGDDVVDVEIENTRDSCIIEAVHTGGVSDALSVDCNIIDFAKFAEVQNEQFGREERIAG